MYDYDSLANLYRNARDADARSAFGSVVVFNKPVDKDTANALLETYVEGVAAPGYEDGAMGILEQKKDMRVVLFSNLSKVPKFIDDDVGGIYDMKVLPTGRVIVQKPYLSSIKGPESLIYHPMFIDKDGNRHVVKRTPTTNEIRDMLTAWYVNIGTRSNGIDIFKDGISIAVGSGQQERVGALENSIIKAYHKAMDREGIKYDPIDGTGIHEDTLNRLRAGIKEYQDAMDKAGIAYVPIEIKDNTFAMMARSELKQNPLSGAVVSSDAFFPFRDSIDTMAKHGIAAVIQPGGSIRDFEVIDAVNEHGMAMVYTLERCFGHF
jgi:phosphoribosylaminoimidazolecarboxamide formyltransferase/IMP cyclohydrolase